MIRGGNRIHLITLLPFKDRVNMGGVYSDLREVSRTAYHLIQRDEDLLQTRMSLVFLQPPRQGDTPPPRLLPPNDSSVNSASVMFFEMWAPLTMFLKSLLILTRC